MRIYVSKKNVKDGCEDATGKSGVTRSVCCPAAQALKKYFRNQRVAITQLNAWVESKSGKTHTEYKVGKKLQKAIEKFDNDGDFPVGHYTLTKVKTCRV